MEPNNLIVTVVSARGLTLKGHAKLEAFASLTINNHGTWKSKVQTDVIKTNSDCSWNQRCEFTINNLDSCLVVAVNHRSVLGTSDCIGALELELNTLRDVQMPTWYRLCKKGKYHESGTMKYRGEILLKFEFANKLQSASTPKLSASTLSINTIHGSSKLDALKRKMHIGKNNRCISDRSSIAGLPQYNRKRSSLCEVCPSSPGNYLSSTADLSSDGLIVPPSAHATSLQYRSLTSKNATMLGNETTFLPTHSRRTSFSSTRNSLNSSPITTVDEDGPFDSSNTLSRPRSVASSGFGSARSAILNVSDSLHQAHQHSREDLLKTIGDLRTELARKEAKIYDLQEYIGRLLFRVMEKDPQLLESKCARPFYKH